MNDVTAIKKGSEEVFGQVYHAYHIKLFRFFLKRVKEHESAKELTQLTYIKLWQSRHTLSVLYTIEVQLMTMAGSVLVDHLRRQISENKLRAVLAETLASRQLHTEPSPGNRFENSDYLNVAIEQLPPVRKKIIRLRMVDGLSNKEIAGLLDISSKTVEDHITKAVKHVRSFGFLLLFVLFLYC